MIQVALLEDHPLTREGIRTVLSQDPQIEVVAELAAPEEVHPCLESNSIDVLISDLSFGDNKVDRGLELLRSVNEAFPACKVLVVSMHAQPETVARALRYGAAGFIPKIESAALVRAAVRRVLSGELFLPLGLYRSIQEEDTAAPGEPNSPSDNDIAAQLTAREFEVFLELGRGRTAQDISEKLFTSISTINTHRENMKRKLGFSSSVELRHFATEWVLRRNQV